MAWIGRLVAALAAMSCGNLPLTMAFPSGDSVPSNAIVSSASVDPWDAGGEDPKRVVDLKPPEHLSNPLDSPGPIKPRDENSCTDLDDDEWRHVTCTDKFIESHVDYSSADRWEGLHVDDAWSSALEYIKCRDDNDKREDSFSNVVSDFFHGPQSMHCQIWNADTNGCSAGTSLSCKEQPRTPVGNFILNSFMKIFDMNWSLYEAFGDVVSFLDIEALASDFGISPSAKGPSVPVSIILDIFMLAFGMVMGPTWNKFIIPKIGGGPNAATTKDTINDLVKNSATLGKDIYTKKTTQPPKDELGLQTAIRSSFKEMGESWRESTVGMNSALFDGSPGSIEKLANLMENGRMLDKTIIEDAERDALQARLKKVMAAFMIPLTWSMSPENFWTVIISEKLACDEDPSEDWTSVAWNYMTSEAYGKRFCKDGESFWLVSRKNYDATCKDTGNLECDPFYLPPGFKSLEDSVYDVSLEDVMEGSINTWKANGRKNVERKETELTNEMLDNILEQGLTTPNVFNIPICSMIAADNNWREAYNGWLEPSWDFPCGAIGDDWDSVHGGGENGNNDDAPAPSPEDFNDGWCTGHITQHQRRQNGVGDRFQFGVKLFDGKGTEILRVDGQEVDEEGNLSIPSVLPFTFDIKSQGGDKDPVEICYADQCFSCPDGEGGHGCTLGNGKANGYEDGNREGDFGFTCKH